MKKLVGIVVLGLLWCNVGFAKVTYLSCENKEDEFKTSLILDHDNKKTVMVDGFYQKVYSWTDTHIMIQHSGGLYVLDRITGDLDDKSCKIVKSPKF